MKLRILLTSLAILLSGCVSIGQTHVLATPFGVAGVHSFAPPNSPDNFRDVARMASNERARQR